MSPTPSLPPTPAALPAQPFARLILAAPADHVAARPLVASAGFTDPQTQRPDWGCPAHEMGHQEWHLWWSLASAPDPHAAVPAAAPARNASRGPPPATRPDAPGRPHSDAALPPFAGPPAGVGRAALVALVPPAALAPGWYALSVSARAKGAGGPRAQTRTALVRVWPAPLCATATLELAVGAGPAGSVAVAGRTALSLALHADCALPTGYAFRWQYQTPDGHAYPLSASARGPRPRLTVVAPWPLPPAPAVPLTLTIRVQDPTGAALGPALGNAAVVVRVPDGGGPRWAGPECASASVWGSLALHLRCHWAEAGVYLRAHVLPALAMCLGRPMLQRLQLLQALCAAFARGLLGALDADFVWTLPPLIARAGDCLGASEDLRQALVALASEGVARALRRDALRRMGEVSAVLEGLASALREGDNCTLPATSSYTAGLVGLALFRTAKTDLHTVALGAVAVRFPPSLQNASLTQAPGATVDVTLTYARGGAPMPTDAVTVTLVDPATAAELPVGGLWDPIVIDFGPPHRTLRQPVAEWYECASHAHGAWDATGLRMEGDARGLRCHTTHLSTFAIIPVVRVTSVRGCALDVPPSSAFCLPDARDSRITVTGGHFGESGARVRIGSDPADAADAAHWECDSVHHDAGDADGVLVCVGMHRTGPPGPPPAHPQWGWVTVVTAHGLAGTFAHPILFAGRHDVPAPCAACARCAPGRYGPECAGACPTSANGAGGAVCAGHGTCDEGLLGSGRCACARSVASGFWAGPDCGDCVPGYFGAGCAGRCPGPVGQPCHAHGVCGDGRVGDGRCRCAPGYRGAACATVCPTATGLPCNGHGDCGAGDQGTPGCNCTEHWAGVACERCAEGWVGPLCDRPCPGATSGAVCGGHGACAASAAGAVCACGRGYAGPGCETECPGGWWSPCHGHGRCNAATARCVCFRNATHGHWSGAACSSCGAGWWGPQCRGSCPRAPDGAPCAGGPCRGGVCVCPPGACGAACNVTGRACDRLRCPAGRYGRGCARVCPGGEARPCAGHGTCLAAMYGTGLCLCDAGYAGRDCAAVCPGGPAAPCSAHGACQPEAPRCVCDPLYATPDCSRRCPVGEAGPCGGHGACNDTAAGDARCTCSPGYAGADCAQPCPGSAPGAPCSGHGDCDPRTATCHCAAGPRGRWAGPACDACAPGYHNDTCAAVCVHGTTTGRRCTCRPGFAGADCYLRCPGPPGAPCHGYGVCHATHATCRCAADYYGPDCSAFCRPERCFAAAPRGYPSPHAQCNPDTGACECQRDYRGQWQGRWCDECLVGHWGEACGLVCQCSGHGGCGWRDGVCACFQDPDRGYWAGEQCRDCLEGYLLPECRVRELAVTRADEVPLYLTAGAGLPGALVVDEAHGLAYAGGRPLWVLRTADGARRAGPVLAGVVRGGAVLPDGVALLVQDPGTGAHSLQKVSRGWAPVVLRPAARARRPHRPQALGEAGAFSMACGSDGLVYWASMSRGVFAVTRLSPALRPLQELRLSPPAFPLDAVRLGVLWAHPRSGAALLLAGARGAEWGLAALPLPGLTSVVDLARAIRVPECEGRCGAPGAVLCLGDRLLLVFERAAALQLVLLAVPSLGNLSAAAVTRAAALDWLGAGPAVTAAAVDPHTRAAFVAAHVPGQPSVVYKIRFDTLTVYGLNRFLARGAARERVRALGAGLRARQLLALSGVAGQPLVVRLLLYAVARAEPPLGDPRGGTLVRVLGEGLANRSGLRCVFAGATDSPATWVSPSEALCLTPPARTPDAGACAADAVELGAARAPHRQRRPAAPAPGAPDPARATGARVLPAAAVGAGDGVRGWSGPRT